MSANSVAIVFLQKAARLFDQWVEANAAFAMFHCKLFLNSRLNGMFLSLKSLVTPAVILRERRGERGDKGVKAPKKLTKNS